VKMEVDSRDEARHFILFIVFYSLIV